MYNVTIFRYLEYGAHATSPTCEFKSNMNKGFLEERNKVHKVDIAWFRVTASDDR